jgi:hypothetical protein
MASSLGFRLGVSFLGSEGAGAFGFSSGFSFFSFLGFSLMDFSFFSFLAFFSFSDLLALGLSLSFFCVEGAGLDFGSFGLE